MERAIKKGINQVLTTILMISIVITLIVSTYIFFSRSASTATEAAQNQTETAIDLMGTKLKIDSVSSNAVYIRNTGTAEIYNTSISLYINEKFVVFNTSGIIKPGLVATLSIPPLPPGNYTVRATAGRSTSSVFVSIN